MNTDDARALIEKAISATGGTWADFGAGDGTFTLALAELLGTKGRIYAVDRDKRALASLGRVKQTGGAEIIPVVADFTTDAELPGLTTPGLDGLLIANALHFTSDPSNVLRQLSRLVRVGGRVVIVEYDRRWANRWVPYPIPITQLPALAITAGLSEPEVIATRPSAYSGIIYAAFTEVAPARVR